MLSCKNYATGHDTAHEETFKLERLNQRQTTIFNKFHAIRWIGTRYTILTYTVSATEVDTTFL
jgi:hypothetical protein